MDSFLTEWNKMVTGKRYRAAMPRFQEGLRKAQLIVRRFNDMSPDDVDGRMALLRGFFAKCGERVQINQPMRCDWGCNISIGHDTFINFNLTILDEAPVTIGNHVFIGPNVSIFTACHPLDAEERNTGDEWAEPVTIGDNVWIGGCVTILPGVTVGHDSVIGAGSVVTKDVAPHTVVAGNPARVIRHI